MLGRLRELEANDASFAFETTLASRSFAPWIKRLVDERRYRFRLMFFWLSSPELAIARVANPVAAGGHHVPDGTVRRRYVGGIRNFFTLYQPIAATWRVYNNSVLGHPRVIAWGSRLKVIKIKDEIAWSQMKKVADEANDQAEHCEDLRRR